MAGLLTDAEVAWMTPIVASSLDVSLPHQRKTVTQDGYGHNTETWVAQTNKQVNVIKPSAVQLNAYADIIGAQWATFIRFMQTTDIQRGDNLYYNGRWWLVQNIENAESYTFSQEALMTVVV